MTKTDFTELLARQHGMTLPYAEKVVNAFLDTIEDALFRDGRAPMRGLGVLDVRESAARKGRHPVTGETIEVPAAKHVRFRQSSTLFLD